MERRRINFLEEGEGCEEQGVKQQRPRAFFCLMTFLILLLGGCTARFFLAKEAPNDPNAYEATTLEQKKPDGFLERIGHFVFSKDVSLRGERDDRVNILLLGMGGPGHDGPYLTDTIILTSIKPSTNQIAMISIPRDLAVTIPGEGVRKINNANAVGEKKLPGSGGELAQQVVENTFNTVIHYYVRVDFTAFKEIIDEIGGITIDVPRSFTDTEYPDGKNGIMTISFQKGIQKMNGLQALQYARSRHGNNTEGSDFARARRQQHMLAALKEKVLSFETLSNPIRIHAILSSLNAHITTNMTFGDTIAILKRAKHLNTRDMITVVFDTNNYLTTATGADGAFLLIPSSGTFKEMEERIENVFEMNEAEIKEKKEEKTEKNPKIKEATSDETEIKGAEEPIASPGPIVIEIQNGTWRAGLAARVKKKLEDAGIPVTIVGNASIRPIAKSGISLIIPEAISLNQITDIKNALGILVIETLPSQITVRTNTEMLIIVGDDYIE